jgi:hypothetical protein
MASGSGQFPVARPAFWGIFATTIILSHHYFVTHGPVTASE